MFTYIVLIDHPGREGKWSLMKAITPDSMPDFVIHQTEYLCDLWNSCEIGSELPLQTISTQKKIHNESILSDLLSWVGNRLERPNLCVQEREDFSQEATLRLKKAGKEIFALTEEQVACLDDLGISRSAEEFLHAAREFDPFMSFADIFQASRNVWTSNYLQVLLGLPVSLSPSIFAYSMLYPVTDNYLDDPRRGILEKSSYSKRFRSWLMGEVVTPQNWNEEDVLDLVRMIERQYPRDCFPMVYDSLLAIHDAQTRSLRMTRNEGESDLQKITAMTLEKGGTSVLADGFLAAGELSRDEMEIIFNYGAFAQLMDDQEDVRSDLKSGSVTLFSDAARRGNVDEVLKRVFVFAHKVLKGLDKFNSAKAIPLKLMSMKGIDLLLIDAALRMESFYSINYLRDLEGYFPFRFEYLKRVRKEIQRKKITAERLTGLLAKNNSQVDLFKLDPGHARQLEPLVNATR